MTAIDLDPNAPHSPQRTRQLLDVAAEAIRTLNYATLPGRGGLVEPGDAHELLGALVQLTGRLPQLCSQTASWLAGEQKAGRVAELPAPRGRYGDSGKAVTVAVSALADAERAANRLMQYLREAQNAITGLESAGGEGEQ